MKEAALIIIKPDGVSKGLVGNVLTKFDKAKLDILAVGMARATRDIAEEHYKHIKNEPFFEDVMQYLIGKFHDKKDLMVIVYYGVNAIKKCREIAGATNPEDADPMSIRGAYGRITTKGIFENVVHVSSDKKEAKREIQLWFEPDNISKQIYKVKIKNIKNTKVRVWA